MCSQKFLCLFHKIWDIIYKSKRLLKNIFNSRFFVVAGGLFYAVALINTDFRIFSDECCEFIDRSGIVDDADGELFGITSVTLFGRLFDNIFTDFKVFKIFFQTTADKQSRDDQAVCSGAGSAVIGFAVPGYTVRPADNFFVVTAAEPSGYGDQ